MSNQCSQVSCDRSTFSMTSQVLAAFETNILINREEENEFQLLRLLCYYWKRLDVWAENSCCYSYSPSLIADFGGNGERVWHFVPLRPIEGPLSGGRFGSGGVWFSGGAGEIAEHQSEGGGETQGVEKSTPRPHLFRGQDLSRLPFRLLDSTKPGGQAVHLRLTGLELWVQAGPLLLSLAPLFSSGEHPGQRHLCLQVGTVPRWLQVTPAALQSAWSVRQSDWTGWSEIFDPQIFKLYRVKFITDELQTVNSMLSLSFSISFIPFLQCRVDYLPQINLINTNHQY